MDYTALKNELQNDPASKGYAAHLAIGELEPIVVELNATDQAVEIDRDVVDSYELVAVVHQSDWATLAASAAKLNGFNILITPGKINLKSTYVRATLQTLFDNTNGTLTRAQALLTRKGSRAESLFGRNVTGDDILKALAS